MTPPTVTLTQALLQRVRRGFAPPPTLTVSQFADQSIIVTSGPLAGTKFQTALAPFQRGIMDAWHEPGIEIVVVMGSSQWGKTTIAVNLCAYHMKHDPCSILVVMPTVEPMAKDFAKNRLDPVIAASPELAEVVSKKRAKDATNTTLQKTFRGGMLALAGANSAASLAARPVRVLIMDEISRWPRELQGEGSTIAIALKRTTTFKRRRRVLMTSSPTLTGDPIDAWHARGDQRRYYVPCPSCATMHPFEWQQVRWDTATHDPATARLHCPACDYAIGDAERVAILGRGEWRAEHPDRFDRHVASFHLWEAYSPFSSLREIVSNFITARAAQKEGDRAEMHSWQNTTLGEPVDPDQGSGVEPNSLIVRRESYGAGIQVPAGACCLTCGVDTQDDRLEAIVTAWGPGEECWFVDRHTFPGDTEGPEPWAMLAELLSRTYVHAAGVTLPILSTCIDSAGHRTTLVYDFAFRLAARRVYAIIGRDGERPIVSSPSPRRWGRDERQVPLYTIGTDAAKSLIVSRLTLTEKGPGYVHLPLADWADEELAAQLTSERLVTKWHKGVPRTEWRKTRARNEGLDCFVYAVAAVRLLNPDFRKMAGLIALAPKALPGAPPAPPVVASPPPGRRVGRSKYLGG